MSERLLRLALQKFQPTGRVSSSQLTPTQRAVLDEFARQTGAINCVRQGRGDVYCITNQSVFDVHLMNLSPRQRGSINPDLPNRAQHIAQARSSKAGSHQHDCYHPLLKAVGENIYWHNEEMGLQLPLSQLSRDFGSASLALSVNDDWYTQGEIWLVENQALFDRTDWLPEQTQATLIYYGGQIDGRLLNWLSHQSRAPKIVHFADYDAVGLANFMRLYARLGEKCVFWLMPNWRNKLARYGNLKLWQDNLDQFLSIQASLPECVQALAMQMAQQGLALEQEVVWVDCETE